METVVEDVKQEFSRYFEKVGGTNFKQFYYDWHVDNMLAPFAGLLTHFHKTYGDKGQAKFAEFVDEVIENVEGYNNDKPQLSLLKTSRFLDGNEHRLTALLNGVEAFGFDFRQFMYSFAKPEDHEREFGHWFIKPNMPYSNQHGLMIGCDILQNLKQNYSEIVQGDDVYRKALYVADVYLRANVTQGYLYEGEYNFENRQKSMRQLRDLKNRIFGEYQNGVENDSLKDMFQVEEKGVPLQRGYLPCGFELEFYVPEEYGDYGKLIDYLKAKNDWKKLYSSNKDSSVYMDRESAGVIMRDESLTRYNNLAAVEYASAVMRSKEDEQRCLKIMDSFEDGHVNVHCSLHQHLSAEGFTLDTYKRLVKRMMRHEAEIVGAFAAPERRDNKLLYATYISRNLSENGQRDYPFLCVMVDLCEDKKQLEEMSAFGHKYKTLNILPDKTVEMRFMNANFNKRFVEAFLQFNREFVNSAVENAPQHVNRLLLNKYNWYNNCQSDDKTVQHSLPYYYQVAYDTYSPMRRNVSKEVVEGEQTYSRLVMHALTETKKLPYVNPSYVKKLREVMGYVR